MTISKEKEPNGLHSVVQRGKTAGTVLVPHLHADDSYVVSLSRFEKDYVRLRSIG